MLKKSLNNSKMVFYKTNVCGFKGTGLMDKVEGVGLSEDNGKGMYGAPNVC